MAEGTGTSSSIRTPRSIAGSSKVYPATISATSADCSDCSTGAGEAVSVMAKS